MVFVSFFCSFFFDQSWWSEKILSLPFDFPSSSSQLSIDQITSLLFSSFEEILQWKYFTSMQWFISQIFLRRSSMMQLTCKHLQRYVPNGFLLSDTYSYISIIRTHSRTYGVKRIHSFADWSFEEKKWMT